MANEARKGFHWSWASITQDFKAATDVLVVLKHLLLPIKPYCHLRVLVLVIRSAVGVLGKVNVEALSVLGVEVVSSPKALDEVAIMPHIMELRNIEIVTNSEIDENIAVGMESLKCVVEP